MDLMATNICHLQVMDVFNDTEQITAYLPAYMHSCNHPAINYAELIAGGVYGKVYGSSAGLCAKVFTSRNAFLQEFVMADLASLAREQYRNEMSTLCMQFYMGACIHCSAIWYPRYNGSLENFRDLSYDHIPALAREFSGLKSAIEFLNKKCGIFHGDVSPDNILVEQDGSETSVIKTLILTDLGTSAIHSGNRFKSVTLLDSSTNAIMYNVQNFRNPFLVCKDDVKPMCILRRCYLLRQHAGGFNIMQMGEEHVDQKMALIIDSSALLQVLLAMLSRIMEMSNERTYESWLSETVDNNTSIYYLHLLAPKLVLLNILSHIWHTNLDVGVNSSGVLASGQLPADHSAVLQHSCFTFEREFETLIFEPFLEDLDDEGLKQIFLELLAFDYFDPVGRNEQQRNGLFAQSDAPGTNAQHGNWRAS